jgi:putative alpha-1,2-mannosidase
VERVDINGNRISRNWIGHDEIRDGGLLFFELDNKANRRRGTADEDLPYSLSRE